jgi:hypothetical protein
MPGEDYFNAVEVDSPNSWIAGRHGLGAACQQESHGAITTTSATRMSTVTATTQIVQTVPGLGSASRRALVQEPRFMQPAPTGTPVRHVWRLNNRHQTRCGVQLNLHHPSLWSWVEGEVGPGRRAQVGGLLAFRVTYLDRVGRCLGFAALPFATR